MQVIYLRRLAAALALIVSPLAITPALANQELEPKAGTWYTQAGAVIIKYRDESEVSINGDVVPGAGAHVHDDSTIGLALGYFITPNLSLMAVLGRGPETEITDNGGNKLGEMWYGAPSLVLDYRLPTLGAIQPFIGIGATYIVVLEEMDGAIEDLEIDSTFGFVLRAGAEVMIDSHWGVFMAANKVFADTSAAGHIGAATVGAEIELDPWIYQGGITHRF